MSGFTPVEGKAGTYRMADGREIKLKQVACVEVLTTSPDVDKAALLAQAAERLARYGGASYTPTGAFGATLGADGLWHWSVTCVRPARPAAEAP